MAENNKGSSEWAVMKWVTSIAGIVGVALGGVVALLTQSGVIETGDPIAVVLGGIAAFLLLIAGKTAGDYIKGRSTVKAAKAKLESP